MVSFTENAYGQKKFMIFFFILNAAVMNIISQRIWKKKWVKCIKIQNSGLKCNALGGKALRK
ncbi:hypothetical protein BpHYR1_017098 [Brachionus plicatilis]|uniref:Uncharacterized protein n=1 Tax=Brachionus plicatilis TaxID=10195 RepID=A0A3M7PQA9_BRAPC|nr:hypothetical protein BpHYR1_017098 [Brachionus plicatilis]